MELQTDRRQTVSGPKGHWIFGNLLDRRSRPLELFSESVRDYGKTVRFRMGPKTVWLLNEPQHIQFVLHDNAKKFIKGFGYTVLELLLGKGLLTSDGEFWHRQRKLIQPVFHRTRIMEFAKVMWDESESLVQSLREKNKVDVTETMLKLTLEIVGKTLFGSSVSDSAGRISQAISLLIEDANRRMLSLLPRSLLLPTPANLRTKKLMAEMDALLLQLIQERRANPRVNANDLLSLLIAARDDETNERMDDRQLRNEAMTIFVAGHETTANALAWTLILLAQNPEIQKQVREEILQEAGGQGPFEKALALSYLSRVIDESLRLYPPAWIISRQPTETVNIDGLSIKPNDVVVISPWVLHRDPDLWDSPNVFDPDRFLPERTLSRHKYAYLPFGGGPRVCIGSQFAKVELLIVLSTLLREFHLELSPDQKVTPHPLVTLRPRGKIQMKFRAV